MEQLLFDNSVRKMATEDPAGLKAIMIMMAVLVLILLVGVLIVSWRDRVAEVKAIIKRVRSRRRVVDTSPKKSDGN